MLRYLLLFFFFLMLAGHELGMNIKLGPGLSTKNVLLYLMVVGIAVNSAVARNRKLESLSVFIPFALLLAYAILTWVITIVFLDRPEFSPRATLISLKSTLVDHFLTLAIFFYGVLNRKDALWLLKAIIVVMIVANGVTIIDSFNVPNLGIIESRARDGRFLGFMGGPNDYGALLVLFLPLSIAMIQTSTGRVRLLVGVGAVLTAACLVLTASRGAFVGIIGGVFLSAVYLRRYVSISLIVRGTVISILALAVLIPIMILSGYSELLQDRFALFDGNVHTASSGRTMFWAKALGVMAENPMSFITGFGYAAYDYSREFNAAMHNHYLYFLFNLGVIGLFLFLVVFGRILAIIKGAIPTATPESRPYLLALVAGLFALLVTQIFGEYSRSAYLIWACIGVGLRVGLQASVEYEIDQHGSAAKGESENAEYRRLRGRPI